MRLISAALLGAAASLPSLGHATTVIPDPADAAALVPAMTIPSAFDGYHSYRDGGGKGPTWQQLNQAVLNKPTDHGASAGKPVEHESDHAMHREATR